MKSPRRFAGLPTCILGLALAVSGCARRSPPPPAPTAAGTEFDGLYAGISTVTRSLAVCRVAPGEKRQEIRMGRLRYPFSPTVVFDVQLLTDGSFSQHIGDSNIEGLVTGRHLDFTLASPRCEYHVVMDRR